MRTKVDVEASAQHSVNQASTGDRLDRLFVAFVESKASQPDIAQLDWIALAIAGCINDALGDHFVNDCRLPLVVKLLASGVAHNPGSVVVKDDPGLFDKRQDRRH